MPRTKIVCTIGPRSSSPGVIRAMINAGMSVARLNFSHGTHAEHLKRLTDLRQIAAELGRPVAILQDLCGPKIRVETLPEEGVRLELGQRFVLTGQPGWGTAEKVSVSYRQLPREVQPLDRIMLADGLMELLVSEIQGDDIICQVLTGGVLTSHKGINVPTGSLKAAALTDKDREDLQFGLAHDVDYVALSFVRSSDDIREVKALIRQNRRDTPVIAKIEKHEALEEIDDILAEADGIMVARGDLGVEIPLETVPNIQKQLIRKANLVGKPVIIATQMLRSMVESPRPTRAEANDVANGVLDGADAVMLSEETASGDYPVESVRYMVRIAQSAEERYPHSKYLRLMEEQTDVSGSVAYAACILAEKLHAAAVVATTRSGATAQNISRFRPAPALIALSPDEKSIRRMALYWGCQPFKVKNIEDTDEMVESAAVKVLEAGGFAEGDLVVITAGRPAWGAGSTNMLWVKKL